MGTMSVRARINGTENSNQTNVFLTGTSCLVFLYAFIYFSSDEVIPKQEYYDLYNGTYNRINFNFNIDPFELMGRAPFILGNTTDVSFVVL